MDFVSINVTPFLDSSNHWPHCFYHLCMILLSFRKSPCPPEELLVPLIVNRWYQWARHWPHCRYQILSGILLPLLALGAHNRPLREFGIEKLGNVEASSNHRSLIFDDG